MNQVKEAISKAPSGRVRRTSLVRKNKLTVSGKDPDFHYRVVNDTEDRVAEFVDAGYEVVTSDKVQVGDKRAGKDTPEGTVKRISVGKGEKGVVMRIRRDWYEEDQAAKQEHVANTERSAKQEALSGSDYGKVDSHRS